jgi:hypothetical protein
VVNNFINTGLVQIQGNKKDAFVHKDFPALLQILDKVTKTVTKSRQNLDKEQTVLKCVEESTDNKLVTTNNDTLRSLLSFSTEAIFEFFFSLSCTGFNRLVIVVNN